MDSKFFTLWVAVSIIVIGRFLYEHPYPDAPPFPDVNVIAKQIVIGSIVIIILYFPIALYFGRKGAKRDLENVEKKSGELKENMKTILLKNQEIISIIPEKYRYPLATSFFAEVLENGRADSMKEAMNLFEEQLHRWKLENKMDTILKNQQKNNNLLWAHIVADIFR